MWVIFLLSAIAFGLVAMLFTWLGNKLFISMKKDEEKTKRELEKENNK